MVLGQDYWLDSDYLRLGIIRCWFCFCSATCRIGSWFLNMGNKYDRDDGYAFLLNDRCFFCSRVTLGNVASAVDSGVETVASGAGDVASKSLRWNNRKHGRRQYRWITSERQWCFTRPMFLNCNQTTCKTNCLTRQMISKMLAKRIKWCW